MGCVSRKEEINAWINVKDRLPNRYESVAVLFTYKKGLPTHGHGINVIDKINETDQWSFYPDEIEITHWTPLPELPKEIQ